MNKIAMTNVQKSRIEMLYWNWMKRYHLKELRDVLQKDQVFRIIIVGKNPAQMNDCTEDRIRAFMLMDAEKLKTKKEWIETKGLKINDCSKNYLIKIYKNYRKSQAGKILRELNFSVCPYCNQNYLYSVIDKHGKTRYLGDLDHFYDKSTWPVFAICLYNLIPSCKVCNQVKSNAQSVMMNPYCRDYKSGIHFATDFDESFDLDYLNGTSDNFEIIIDKTELSPADQNEIDQFYIEGRYKELKRNVREIILKSKAYDKIYEKLLKDTFDCEEIESYMCGYSENEVERTLSRFNRDIWNEFRN